MWRVQAPPGLKSHVFNFEKLSTYRFLLKDPSTDVAQYCIDYNNITGRKVLVLQFPALSPGKVSFQTVLTLSLFYFILFFFNYQTLILFKNF